MTPDAFRTFARYNRWANARLYDAVAELPPGVLEAPRPAAYFGSLLGTLNHILVGDHLWLDRIEGVAGAALRLDQILYRDLAALRRAREVEDGRIERVVDGLDPTRLAGDLAYRTVKGEAHTTPLPLVLAHLFNHQTHHRGQAHALLKDAGTEPPPLDLIYFLRAEGGGPAA